MKCPKCNFENPADTFFCGKCGESLNVDEPSEQLDPSFTKTLQTPIKELHKGATLAGRYQIMEELGKGGMSRVYKALDKEIKEYVAIKLLKQEIAEDEATIERFRNELKIARKVTHINVCRMHDIGKENGSYYISMELVPGEDLKKYIKRKGKLSEEELIPIAIQVCEGLAQAHELGVIHRDLKPQNIMIDEKGHAKIMDFGLARSLEAPGVTKAGVMIGTPDYISPEQAEGEEADQRSDIYSFGVILYEMATGQVPFKGDSALSVALKHKSQLPQDPKKLNPELSDDLAYVILRSMEKAKEGRYQSTKELFSELTKIGEGIALEKQVSLQRGPFTLLKQKKHLFPVLILLMMAILAVTIWRLLPRKEIVYAPKIDNSIAVISFVNQTGDEAYDHLQKSIPDLLTTNLENSGHFHMVTWERMYDLLIQMGKRDMEIIDSDLGFELCRIEGVEVIILGSIIKTGDMFAINARVLDVETKKLLRSASSKGRGEDSIIETQIDDLSNQISLGMGISSQEIEATHVRIVDLTTTSQEAYKNFLKGKEEYIKRSYERSRPFFERAIELDPTYATAYLYLAQVYGHTENDRARNEAYVKAKEYSFKLTPKEKLYIEGVCARGLERDPEKAFRIFQEMVKKYPKEKKIYYELASFYHMRDMDDKAIEELHKVLALDPYNGDTLVRLGYRYADVGDYESALEYFKKYAALYPGEPNPLDSLAEHYFRMGRLDDSLLKYKEVLKVDPYFRVYDRVAYIYALKEEYTEATTWIEKALANLSTPELRADEYTALGFYHFWLGRMTQSLSDLNTAMELGEAIGIQSIKANVDWISGWLYLEKGEFQLCHKYFNDFLNWTFENYPNFKSYNLALININLGFVNLKEGKIKEAKKRLSEIDSLLPIIVSPHQEWMLYRYDIFRGEILHAEGSFDKAISVLRDISPLGMPPVGMKRIAQYNVPFYKDILARVYQQIGELDKAIVEYERLITFDPNKKERCLIHPKYYYRLAKLCEKKGWKGKAIENYEKFLEIWREADTGTVEVEDAQIRLAKLRE